MIIDLILDRKDGINKIGYNNGRVITSEKYKPKAFYNELMEYYNTMPELVEPIANAMDEGTEQKVKNELARYIIEQEYNLDIIAYINSVKWL